METMRETTEYHVPECNLSGLQGRIDALNKRARRLRVPEITMTATPETMTHEYATDYGVSRWIPESEAGHYQSKGWRATGRVMTWYAVQITGETPKFAGWEFIATLEPIATDSGTYNLAMVAPGHECPGEFMVADAVGRCDHCNARRNRKQTFVVRHEDGTHKAVGRQCIRDFLGHEDPNRLAAWAEIMASLGEFAGAAENEDWGFGGEGPAKFDLLYFLEWTAGVVRQNGWLGRGKAREIDGWATADHVLNLVDPPKMTGKVLEIWKEDRDACRPTEKEKTEALTALEWALELDADALIANGGNNYLANVAIIARAGFVAYKTAGIAASIIAAAAREQDKAREATETPESHAVGAIGKRAEYRVRVDRVIPRENQYGVTYITAMTAWDSERECFANKMVWFASREHDFEPGGEYTVRATVKDHTVYNGQNQTMVTRVA